MLQPSTFSLACFCLEKAGFKVYTSINPGDVSFIIETPEEGFCRVIFRNVSLSGRTPVLTLSAKNQTEHFISSVQFFLLACFETGDVWLVPSHQIPLDTRSLRLGNKMKVYLLKPEEQEHKGSYDYKLKKELTKRVQTKREAITQEDIEQLLEIE